jgi:hypothetical protein
MGPLADSGGCYPKAEPKPIDVVVGVVEMKELHGLLVHDDGEELLPYPPTSRYGIGVLFPRLTIDAEKQLNSEEEPANEESSVVQELLLTPPEVTDLGKEIEDPPEDPVIQRAPRPSAMGFSFVVARSDHVDVTLRMARYEEFLAPAGNATVRLWHRLPTEITHRFYLSSPSSPPPEFNVVFGPNTAKIGCVVRGSDTAEQIVTCYVRNSTPLSSGDQHPASGCLFQVELRAHVSSGDLLPYPNALGLRDQEDAMLSLLYTNSPVRAVGHGCDAITEDTPSGQLVRSQVIPIAAVLATNTDVIDTNGDVISVEMKALGDWEVDAVAAVERIIEGYDAWIKNNRDKAISISDNAASTAEDHLSKCETFLNDLREGWALAKSDADVQQCLRWVCHAMSEQQRSYRATTRTITKVDDRIDISPPTRDIGPEPAWRGFQIAFVLASMVPAIQPDHRRRDAVDVIWMPTGGGKTEAYLGLAAFTILWRRLHDHDKDNQLSGDTTVLMRYTLRLLTAQQLQRTASLICALERIRKDQKERLGERRFTVGAWLGSASTPNTHDGSYGAVAKLKSYKTTKRGDRPFLLNRCPWCACQFVDDAKNVYGYDIQPLKRGGTRMRARCPDQACPFFVPENERGMGLPVYEVDRDIYERSPTFIIGTVDKFAMLAWREEPRSFFGIATTGLRERPGPDLIIQDELHLITGPLGSLVGLYEAGISALCLHDGGHHPRIVAATATTRAYEAQARQVFGTKAVRLLPPPGLRIEDNFFSHTDSDPNLARVHVGICATGLGQFTRSQARVFASLAHAVGVLSMQDEMAADYYWTNLTFFGSLRDLGTAKSILTTDIGAYQWNMVRATGVNSGPPKKGGGRFVNRFLQSVELTSTSTQSASENLERLERMHNDKGCPDLALATSVIEVGVDVPRLGLLTIVRQPKTAATYIQVSGRVGRVAKDGPGLVVVILSPLSGRDISHYERFTSFHNRLYEAVEPATVTPFTDAALERGVRGVVASVVRQTRPMEVGGAHITAEDIVRAEAVVEKITERAESLFDRAAGIRVRTNWNLAAGELNAARTESLPWGTVNGHGRQFLRVASDVRNMDEEVASWSVLTSLRNVDATAGTRIHADWVRVDPAPPLHVPGTVDTRFGEGDEEAEF